MTVELFLAMLMFYSTATSLVTEGLKKINYIKEKVPYNIVVLVVAMVVGCGLTSIYYIANGIPWTTLNIIYLVLMGIANWLGAMVGYDKVKQLIGQIGA